MYSDFNPLHPSVAAVPPLSATVVHFPRERVRAAPQPHADAAMLTDLGVAMSRLRTAVTACQKALSVQNEAALALVASIADMRDIATQMVATNRKVQDDVARVADKAAAFRMAPAIVD